jgi:hypothetical protein
VFCVGFYRSVVLSKDDLGPQAVAISVVVVTIMKTATMLLPIATTFDEDALVFTRKLKI